MENRTVFTMVLTTSGRPGSHADLPIFGYPGFTFYLIHITAIVSLSISILVSGGVLLYLTTTSARAKKSFFRLPIGDRLVVYLAIVDLCYSISHELDHCYMLAVVNHPPDTICRTFAFFLQTFIIAQSLLVLYTAASAMVSVVFERKISLGKYDWRLFATMLGVPLGIGIAGATVPFLGPAGPWCFVDMRQSYGDLVNSLYGFFFILVFFINTVSYGAVWAKIHKVGMASSGGTGRYHRAAKMMMIFVAAFVGQWTCYAVQAVWGMVVSPPLWIFVLTVIFSNMGGVFNAVAYTGIHRSRMAKKNKHTTNVVSVCSNGTVGTRSTVCSHDHDTYI